MATRKRGEGGGDGAGLENAGLDARVDVLHQTAHDVPHLGVLAGDVDAVQELHRLYHSKYLIYSADRLVCEVRLDKVDEQLLQFVQLLDHKQTVIRVVDLVEADECHGDRSQFALDLQQPDALVLVELLPPLQHPNLDGDLDDVPHSLLGLVLVLRENFEEEVEVVEQTGASVVDQGLGHRPVAEELVGKALLNLVGHHASLKVGHVAVQRGVIKPYRT